MIIKKTDREQPVENLIEDVERIKKELDVETDSTKIQNILTELEEMQLSRKVLKSTLIGKQVCQR